MGGCGGWVGGGAQVRGIENGVLKMSALLQLHSEEQNAIFRFFATDSLNKQVRGIENGVLKMSALLQLGFGEAGACARACGPRARVRTRASGCVWVRAGACGCVRVCAHAGAHKAGVHKAGVHKAGAHKAPPAA